jgi:hypothetical protein
LAAIKKMFITLKVIGCYSKVICYIDGDLSASVLAQFQREKGSYLLKAVFSWVIGPILSFFPGGWPNSV